MQNATIQPIKNWGESPENILTRGFVRDENPLTLRLPISRLAMVDDVGSLPSTAVCTKMQRDVTLYGVRNICDYQIIFTDFVNNYESERIHYRPTF